jgi:leucyl-tRNA synthetase
MSKSKYNVINPDDVVADYGADTFRMYEMFLGPVEQSKPWNTQGIDGVFKFLRKYWELSHNDQGELILSDDAASPEALKVLHTCIKKVRNDIERFSFNTCVSSFMVCVNDLKKLKTNNRAIIEPLTKLLAPFAPHISEEVWSILGNKESIHHGAYPEHDEKYLVEDSFEYPICINGKKRTVYSFSSGASNADIEAVARELDEVKKWTADKQIRKVIVVPKRMVNIVVG